jgi:nucleotide-binding universal stress UspA family protein
LSELLAIASSSPRRRILVGLLPDAPSRAVLRRALQLCRPRAHSELHVAEAVCLPARLHDRAHVAELAALLREKMAQLRAYVDARARCARGPERVFHVRVGGASDVLRQIACEIDADVIVVGGQAPYGCGTLAGALIRLAEPPVVVARVRGYCI